MKDLITQNPKWYFIFKNKFNKDKISNDLANYHLLKNSKYFNEKFYTKKYNIKGINPIIHYLKYGYKEGKNPSRIFNTNYYLNNYGDIKKSGMNPLIHYIKHGKKQGRFKNKKEFNHSLILKVINHIHSYNYSFSRYLKLLDLKQVTVFSQDSDWDWVESICIDLELSFDIQVKEYITDSPGNNQSLHISQNIISPVISFHENFSLTENDIVLILSSNKTNQSIKNISTSCETIHILDLLDGLIWESVMGQKIDEIRLKFPFLPIIFFDDPKFPLNKEEYSNLENYLVNELPGHYVGWFEKLKSGEIDIPKTFLSLGYDEKEDIIEMLDFRSNVVNNKISTINHEGKYVNIENNHRIVPNNPKEFERTFYIFGGCINYGVGCPDNGTNSFHLQKFLNDDNEKILVQNYGNFVVRRGKYIFEKIMHMDFKPGDVLIFSVSSLINKRNIPKKDKDNIYYINTTKLLERPHNYGENVFFDTAHPNEIGQIAIASALFDFLKEHEFFKEFLDFKHEINNNKNNTFNNTLKDNDLLNDLNEYKTSLSKYKPIIGSIVMNANPFTLGHRYLVEYALSNVDKLFVFVVEENKSFFTFEERINLVKENLKDLDNIIVIPSGKFIISSITFNDYFGKDFKQEDSTIDPTMDVELFGREIAPTLGINIRFAGEEPNDNVTLKYNETMKKILPKYGIDFKIIPRKEINGNVISASSVREIILDSTNMSLDKWDEIIKLVPEKTYSFLREKFNKKGV
ncbi:MAG: adenylyltransferase/cytidyltransferase family protein [Methanobrevibacter sp.]|nr:adenylyltransferase/cytidyltransferase family protein [Candidatus Methanoflexus mossambicus]